MILGEIVEKTPLKRGVLGGFGRLMAGGLALRLGGLGFFGILILVCVLV